MSERPWHEGLDWNTIHTETITLEPRAPMVLTAEGDMITVSEWLRRECYSDDAISEVEGNIARFLKVPAESIAHLSFVSAAQPQEKRACLTLNTMPQFREAVLREKGKR